MKEITKEELVILETNHILRNTKKGYLNRNGNVVSYYRTRHKRYIEDTYADIAHKLSE